jgi:hypothetical protein
LDAALTELDEALAKQPSPDESLDEAEGEEIMRSAPRQAGHYDAADPGSPDLPSLGSVDEVERKLSAIVNAVANIDGFIMSDEAAHAAIAALQANPLTKDKANG